MYYLDVKCNSETHLSKGYPSIVPTSHIIQQSQPCMCIQRSIEYPLLQSILQNDECDILERNKYINLIYLCVYLSIYKSGNFAFVNNDFAHNV